jgi:hypothetical protein
VNHTTEPLAALDKGQPDAGAGSNGGRVGWGAVSARAR